MTSITFTELHDEILACRICEPYLDAGVNPIVQIHPKAKILIAGQAPGRKVHETNIPFNDASGDRLRDWMGIDKASFYDSQHVAIVPMGFCFPGSDKSGDLAPRKECARQWRQSVLDQLPNIQLTILIGTFAMKWHLGNSMGKNLTETVQNWQSYPEGVFPLPHPSPRNFGWFMKNPWFDENILPELKTRIAKIT
ncbi:MAG: uracil-DNA glycosylase family protein [Pseudomonadales bacterium]|jgi:uracil-DNA glycosylase|tara:strand:+ start:1339 stop:1923 length:585 start_codon:yes stop_codon:yes gene_type:complete